MLIFKKGRKLIPKRFLRQIMVKEKQEKRFLEIFNRNEEAAAAEFLIRQLYLQRSPLQAFSMNLAGNF